MKKERNHMVAIGSVLFLIGLIGSFLSGMLGMGGAIINYPMLLFVPPLLGVAQYTPHEVSCISMVQVFFTTLAGVLAYRKSPVFSKTLALRMGIPCLVMSLIGGIGASLISSAGINFIYLLMAIFASVMMVIPRKVSKEQEETTDFKYSLKIAVISSGIVGGLSGIVGAGGAFMLIPIMLSVLKIPTRVTIATSLAIVFLSSIGGTMGKLISGDVLWFPSTMVVLASILGAPAGAFFSRRVSIRSLRYMLAVLILLSSLKMAIAIF